MDESSELHPWPSCVPVFSCWGVCARACVGECANVCLCARLCKGENVCLSLNVYVCLCSGVIVNVCV